MAPVVIIKPNFSKFCFIINYEEIKWLNKKLLSTGRKTDGETYEKLSPFS